MPQDENAETSIMKNRWLQLVVGIAGIVYGTAAVPRKWFPDRSGLAAGLTAAADLAQGQR
jgi:hypothetical protein